MDISFEEVKGRYNGTVKSFPNSDLAKEYCITNELCKAVSGDSAIISYDEMEDSDSVILRKINNNFLSRASIEILNQSTIDIKKLTLSFVESDARTILIIYKAPGEPERFALDFSKSELYGVMFKFSNMFELKSLNLPSGKYIVRQVFFTDVKEDMDCEYSIFMANTQIVTYIDNVMVKRSWPINEFTNHTATLKIKKGIRAIVNDFSFDTEKSKMDLGDEQIEMMVMPAFNKELIDPYDGSDIFQSTISKLEDKEFKDYCTADKLTEKKCLERLKFSETSRQIVQSYEIENILPFVEYVYKNDDVDYDTARNIKLIAEEYLVSKFSNLDFKDLDTIMFLLNLTNDIVKKKLANQEFLEECLNESSDVFKKGVCRIIENSIPEKSAQETKRIYAYCISPNGNKFNFDNDPKCGDISEDIRNSIRVAKCDKYIDNEYCKNLSWSNEEVKLRRILYLDDLLSTKEGIKTLAKNYNTEFGKSLRDLDDAMSLSYRNQKKYDETLIAYEKARDTDMSIILADALQIAISELDAADVEYKKVEEFHRLNEKLYPEEFAAENNRKEILKFIQEEYAKDKTIDQFITDLYEKTDCEGCEELYDVWQAADKDSAEIIRISRKLKNRSNIFSLDPEDIMINSNEVLKFCKKEPTSEKCIDYYTKVYKMSTFDNPNTSPTITFVAILFLILACVCFVFVILPLIKKAKRDTGNQQNNEQ